MDSRHRGFPRKFWIFFHRNQTTNEINKWNGFIYSELQSNQFLSCFKRSWVELSWVIWAVGEKLFFVENKWNGRNIEALNVIITVSIWIETMKPRDHAFQYLPAMRSKAKQSKARQDIVEHASLQIFHIEVNNKIFLI